MSWDFSRPTFGRHQDISVKPLLIILRFLISCRHRCSGRESNAVVHEDAYVYDHDSLITPLIQSVQVLGSSSLLRRYINTEFRVREHMEIATWVGIALADHCCLTKVANDVPGGSRASRSAVSIRVKQPAVELPFFNSLMYELNSWAVLHVMKFGRASFAYSSSSSFRSGTKGQWTRCWQASRRSNRAMRSCGV